MLIIALLVQALGCSMTRTIDLKFIITSIIDDLVTSDTSFDQVVCDGRSAVYGVKTTEITAASTPTLTYIWDVGHATSLYSCSMSKSFFVPGRIIAATLDVYSDDYILVKINDVQVTEVSTTAICTMQANKNVLPYLKFGINSLYILATNTLSAGYFGYRITIWTQLV